MRGLSLKLAESDGEEASIKARVQHLEEAPCIPNIEPERLEVLSDLGLLNGRLEPQLGNGFAPLRWSPGSPHSLAALY